MSIEIGRKRVVVLDSVSIAVGRFPSHKTQHFSAIRPSTLPTDPKTPSVILISVRKGN